MKTAPLLIGRQFNEISSNFGNISAHSFGTKFLMHDGRCKTDNSLAVLMFSQACGVISRIGEPANIHEFFICG